MMFWGLQSFLAVYLWGKNVSKQKSVFQYLSKVVKFSHK